MYPSLMTEEEWCGVRAEHDLTRREMEVIDLLCRGVSQDSICARLGIAGPTLKAHRRAAYRKLGVANRVELILNFVHGRDGAAQRSAGRAADVAGRRAGA